MSDLSYVEAIAVGLLQGVSELFPVSSLGHSVLLPALAGGQWAKDLSLSGKETPYLAVLVAMHVATALALVVFYWRDWVRIIRGLWTSILTRKIENSEQRLGWLLVVGTIPVGIAGIALDSLVRNFLGKPVPTAIFLALNGLVLFAVERLQHRRRETEEYVSPDQTMVIPNAAFSSGDTAPLNAITAEPLSEDEASERRLSKLQWKEAALIGGAQALALLPGISRSGITIVAGLTRGLRHVDAARFAFLLATPVILGAGVFKMPELFKPEVHGSLGPALVGSVVAGVAAYVSARFLASYFETRTLNPFAIYCMVAGIGSLAYFVLAGIN
ncbi:undecaprenyl-diphosphate phosphatase [Kutzneria buriramensis]|uniref:Undecaprenyl-diphosphatase n=1 Tax=Kutzneria buriramensis TaxID=1045776 RepID=A0A3E0HZX4_9PSEU|nr:undecaprenyl-diphosphate phosphatase [Kutzneria buriramensis]REH52012.1 undecaprenyl-diphosphatase [Kutzneria buriramensis]